MLVSIGHVTRYTFASPANYSIHTLHLTPPTFEGQRVLSWRVEMPGIDKAVRFRDAFGNVSHLVSIPGPHSEITIIARGTVETHDKAGFVRGLTEVSPTQVFKRETEKTAPDDAIREMVADLKAPDRIDRLHELMQVIGERVKYTVGATTPHTSAAEALKNGRGVCQDHAHVFIAAARLLGFPARYVSGYFVTGGEYGSEAQHAWAEVFIDGLGWLGFDPANQMCPTDRYVRLACGLDAASAAPITGNRRGGFDEVLDVFVEVQQQSSAQQQ
ncbi:transglutaminase family protein [Hyphomicrobium sp. xq]|uniref:Transglutaminase family protein n=1 Tax=Hyphomicrobium album TaxID=2665159 RepID=A0A6I3KHH3_9HYPH|nr:transglutaminase family protein [Hyphomicrobium album]MTD95125.1 transglutaminase family protein [Hyphomicrobium album]